MRGVVGIGERHTVGQAGLEQLAGGIVGVASGPYSRGGRDLGDGLDPSAGVIAVLGLGAVGIGLLGHAAGCVVAVIGGDVAEGVSHALKLATLRAGRTGVIGQSRDIRDIGAWAVDLDDLAGGIVLQRHGARDRIAGGGEAALGGGDRIVILIGDDGLLLLAGVDARA